jgi:hypothetical protein
LVPVPKQRGETLSPLRPSSTFSSIVYLFLRADFYGLP